MTSKASDREAQIMLCEAALAALHPLQREYERHIKLLSNGIEEMYDSPEKVRAIERLGEDEIDLENIKEKIKAVETWLVDVGAKGWGIKL